MRILSLLACCFALSLAAELAPAIRVNVVAPSLTRTPLAESITRNATLASGIASMHALQRLGEPEDVAALASDLYAPGRISVAGIGPSERRFRSAVAQLESGLVSRAA